MEYNFREIEKKWQQRWVEEKTYQVTEDESKQKFYVLNMFPYPSGAGSAGACGSLTAVHTTGCDEKLCGGLRKRLEKR